MDRFDASKYEILDNTFVSGKPPRQYASGFVSLRCENTMSVWICNPKDLSDAKAVFYKNDRHVEFHCVQPTQYFIITVPDAKIFSLTEETSTFTDISTEEQFTNLDRMPQESGQLYEIQKAMRLFELQRQQALQEARDLANPPAPEPAPPTETQNGASS